MSQAKSITFVIPGKPVGKPRQTQADRWRQRPCVMRYRYWADLARLCAKQAGGVPDAEQVKSLSCVAEFSPAASWSKKKQKAAIGTFHRRTPDADNLLKAALDALFVQDQAIPNVSLLKIWSDVDRMTVTIEV